MLCYVRKVKNSQARTGHQRGMDGRGTDDDDTPRGDAPIKVQHLSGCEIGVNVNLLDN